MYRLTKSFRFEAAHKLPKHDGKCQRLHGHSWVMRVVLEGLVTIQDGGPKSGMLQDFADVSALVKPLVDSHLDHHYLNETTYLPNPTSEELARWIYNRLKGSLPLLVAVEVDETCTSSCCYRPT